MKDMLAPVIKLVPLTYEEMLILIEKLADIHSQLFDYEQTITEEDMVNFIKIEYGRIGANKNITPREVIRDFIELMNIVYQNPTVNMTELLNSESFEYAKTELEDDNAVTDEFAEFEI